MASSKLEFLLFGMLLAACLGLSHALEGITLASIF